MRIYENISYYADIPYKYTGTSSSAEMKQSLKEKFTPEWPFIFFTPIKSL